MAKKNILINIKRENKISELKSLLKRDNQTELAISLANFFSDKDLYNICNGFIKNNIKPTRSIEQKELTLYKYIRTSNKSELEIKDILLMDRYPPVRFIEIITRLSPVLDYNRFKYYYYPNIYDLLNKIIADAYNYRQYCSSSLTTYTVDKSLLYKNYSSKVVELFKKENINIERFNYLILFIIEIKLFEDSSRFIKIFNINKTTQLELMTLTDDVIKISINNKNERVYVYLDRHFKGLAQLKLILELINHEMSIE